MSCPPGKRGPNLRGAWVRWLLPAPASAADQRTAALSEGPERLRGRDRRAQLVVVPGMLRLVGPLHLEQIHVVNFAAVGTNAALTEQRVVRRHVLHLRNYRLAVAGTADRDDRLEVVRHRGVDAGMDHGRVAAAMGGGEGLRECTVGLARVPIPGLGEHQSLRGLETERIDVADVDQHAGELLPAAAHAEL